MSKPEKVAVEQRFAADMVYDLTQVTKAVSELEHGLRKTVGFSGGNLDVEVKIYRPLYRAAAYFFLKAGEKIMSDRFIEGDREGDNNGQDNA
jgi:hypothetical protein